MAGKGRQSNGLLEALRWLLFEGRRFVDVQERPDLAVARFDRVEVAAGDALGRGAGGIRLRRETRRRGT